MILMTALFRAVSFSQAPLILEDADLSPDAVFLHRTEAPFFFSPFQEWENIQRLRLRADNVWTPTLGRRGRQSATLSAYGESQTLYYGLGTQADVKFGRRNYRSDFAWKDSAVYALGMRSQRNGYPFGALYHLIPAAETGTRLDLLVDFPAVDQLEYTVGFDWRLASGAGKNSGIRWQLSHSYRDGSEDVDFQDLRPAGGGERVHAQYASRWQSVASQWEFPWGPGALALCAKYSWSSPNLLRSEYNLTDSSQTLRLGSAYRFPQTLGSLEYAYAENQVRTLGLRVPPGSAGAKRFHYALSSTHLDEVRWESPKAAFLRNGQSSLDLGGNWLALRSSPSTDAVNERKETLSYNRLGLSYIADIYGGFSRNAEVVTVNGGLRQIEGTLRHAQRISGLQLNLALPMAFTWLNLDVEGKTVDQGVFTTTVDRTYAYARRGRILSVTPRLSLEWAQRLWGEGILKLGGKASQVLLIWNDIEDGLATGEAPQTKPPAPASAPRSTYPAGANGFLGEVTLALDF